jgi:tRNA dimethylallyltransferase
MTPKPKLIVVLGPTATGKSDLAVELAREFNGEIISADSRQVYRGLDIGSGKITKREMRGVPHHLLDVANPKRPFSVAQYQRLALRAISGITQRGKTPIVCGGTGFYIQSIIENTVLPNVPPNPTLRKELSQKSVRELFTILTTLDPERAQNIDTKNPVRLVRAIEIASLLGHVPKSSTKSSSYDVLQIGLTLPPDTLRKKIHLRLQKRLKQGMITEGKHLHKNGLSWKRMRELGLEYRALADFLTHTTTREQMTEKLTTEIYQYTRRQMTWFKRDESIEWFAPTQTTKIVALVMKFLKTSK